MREICTSGSMRGEAATMVTLVPPLLLYCGLKHGPHLIRCHCLFSSSG